MLMCRSLCCLHFCLCSIYSIAISVGFGFCRQKPVSARH